MIAALFKAVFGVSDSDAKRYPDVERFDAQVAAIKRKHGVQSDAELCERAVRGGLDPRQFRGGQ